MAVDVSTRGMLQTPPDAGMQGVEEDGSEEAEPVRGLQSGAEKQGREEAVSFACFPFLRGKVLRMFVC